SKRDWSSDVCSSDLSPPIPPNLTASCTTSSLPVFLTDSTTVSVSNGTSVLGSTTSTLIPFSASSSAASSDLWTIIAVATIVASVPSCLMSALLRGMLYCSSGTSPDVLYNSLCS